MPTQHQTSIHLIVHQTDKGAVQQRASDGYINATELCKAAGRRWNDYKSTATAKAFFAALSAKTGIPVLEIYQEVRDKNGIASTWIHPKAAIHLGQWVSPEFAVQVSEWIHDWLSGRGSPSSPVPLPVH